MKTRLLTTVTALALSVLASAPAHAVTAVALKLTNAAGTWLQVPEVQVFNSLGVNVAAAANGGSASAQNSGTWNAGSTAAGAINGVPNQVFNFGATGVGGDLTMYHPAVIAANDALFVTFSSLQNLDIRTITLFGRLDCCGAGQANRNLYNWSLLDANNAVVTSGTLDTNNALGIATSSVPEPATWAMMMVGFGLLGFGLRRRSSSDARVSFNFA